MVPHNPNLERLLSSLDRVSETANGWDACCPAHEDDSPSLSIAVNDDGQILLNCHVGCSTVDIVQMTGMSMSDLFVPRDKGFNPEWGRFVKAYDYHTPDGQVAFQVCRFEKDGHKTFRQGIKEGDRWKWGVQKASRYLYRLPSMLAQSDDVPVFIIEGEKAVDYVVREHALNATCNPMGAGSWDDRYNAYLMGRDVIIVPDNDPVREKRDGFCCVGREHAEQVADALSDVARSVRVVCLPPDAGEKWGLDDWMELHSIQDLESLVEESPVWIKGTKLFDRGTTRYQNAETDGDPWLWQRECCQAIGVDVLGETEDGKVYLYSRYHRKTMHIRDPSKLRIEHMIQFAGPPALQKIYTGKDDTPLGSYKMADVRNSICALAGCRRVEDSMAGAGVWKLKKHTILVGSGEAAILNGTGSMEQLLSAELEDQFFDLSDVSRPWFDLPTLQNSWSASSSPDWCIRKIEQLESTFAHWSFRRDEGAAALLCGLVLATWTQSMWKWRPQVFILGESNVGKSSLFQLLAGGENEHAVEGIFGSLAIKSSNYTAAALQQSIGQSSKIAICDEFESGRSRDEILKMVRAAGRGDPIIRGTTSHRAKSFSLRQIFWMASTETGLKREVDQNRFIVVELVKADAEKFKRFSPMSPADARKLGTDLLAIAVRHAERAVTLSGWLYQNRPPNLHSRVCESYAVPAASYAAACGVSDDEALNIYQRFLTLTDEDQVEADQLQLLSVVMGSLVDCGKGERRSVGELLGESLSGYLETRYEQALERHGIAMRRSDERAPNDSPPDVFFYPRSIERFLLRGTDFERMNLKNFLSRIPGSRKTKKHLAGMRPWGYLIPAGMIPELESVSDGKF